MTLTKAAAGEKQFLTPASFESGEHSRPGCDSTRPRVEFFACAQTYEINRDFRPATGRRRLRPRAGALPILLKPDFYDLPNRSLAARLDG
jgi:hypothetical protein